MNIIKKIIIVVTFLVTISLLINLTGCYYKPEEELDKELEKKIIGIIEEKLEEKIEEIIGIEETIKAVETTEETTPTKEVSEEETSVEESITEEIKEEYEGFFIGETIVVENYYELTIHSAEIYEAESRYKEPGFKIIAIDIEIKNISNEIEGYNELNYEIQDSDRYVYEREYCGKEPSFSSGDISSGQSRRGWATFKVMEDAEIVAIIAQPFYHSVPITIRLNELL